MATVDNFSLGLFMDFPYKYVPLRFPVNCCCVRDIDVRFPKNTCRECRMKSAYIFYKGDLMQLAAVKGALSHMTFWIIQHIQTAQNAAHAIDKNEALSPEDKQKQHLTLTHTFLSLFIILQPAFEIAKAEYPQYATLIDWADTILKDAFAKGNITGTCACNNCTPPQTSTQPVDATVIPVDISTTTT